MVPSSMRQDSFCFNFPLLLSKRTAAIRGKENPNSLTSQNSDFNMLYRMSLKNKTKPENK